MPEIVALSPQRLESGDERYRFAVDGAARSVRLKLRGLNRQLASDLEPWVLDLIEIAALVYGADASVSRGSPTDPKMGKALYRRFTIKAPVRDMDRWTRPDVIAALERTLHFLSGDTYTFEFKHVVPKSGGTGWIDFGEEAPPAADRVLLFSGGLDSFAGALEELADHGHRVALVSHFSSPRIVGIQRQLIEALKAVHGRFKCQHIRAQIQMEDGTTREATHRTRSFLFAALGFATAQTFGLDRLSFHENGVVSLNVPPVDNVQSTRATRTTHPQTLVLFSHLLTQLSGADFRVDNPFFWRTKADVVETIRRLAMPGEIAHTTSCADTRNRDIRHPHCGRCSQCIDRRFAILAKGLGAYDPEKAYEVDLMTGARERVEHRETALSYLRNALAFEHADPRRLVQDFPWIVSAVDHLDIAPDVAAERIAGLLRRHGSGVANVMRAEMQGRLPSSYPEHSLPRLFGDVQRPIFAGLPAVPLSAAPEPSAPVRLVLHEPSGVTIAGVGKISGRATSQLLALLAQNHLDARGQGLDLFDTPFVESSKMTRAFKLDGDEALRKRVWRAKRELEGLFRSAGLDAEQGKELIENMPWQGYRLRPEDVEVRIDRPPPRRTKSTKSSSDSSKPP